MAERLAELTRAAGRDHGPPPRRADRARRVRVLVDGPGVGRSHREAPEIDGVIDVRQIWRSGSSRDVEIVDALGPDLVAAGALVDGEE